ncbi:SLC13 family permease [Oligella urethralis]|uniref:SLC13 family permease n=1 Tax=Oligella urethralis TaxID=90245 RepID=UPI00242AB3B5|nr:SLC13 family permease [Oligella urethralis]
MTTEIVLVLLITVIAMVLFITEKVRYDGIGLLVLASLTLFGLVTPSQALSGFSNEATITIASMFILAAALENTGALNGFNRLFSYIKSPWAFYLTLFGVLAIIAPFVNNTAVVAVFIPIVISASLKVGLAPSKTLIPLSYVSQMAGVMTLIGTSTNLIVNSVAKEQGFRGFSMFEFLPLGAICFVAGCLYLITIGRRILPDVKSSDLFNLYDFGHYVTELYITDDSSLVDTSFSEAGISQDYSIYLIEVRRDGEKIASPRSSELEPGDILLVRGRWDDIRQLTDDKKLKVNNQLQRGKQVPEGVKWSLAEIMIAPNSRAIGRSMVLFNRTWKYNSLIMGIQRRGNIIRSQLEDIRLQVGDIILLAIPEDDLNALQKDKHVILLSQTEVRNRAKKWKSLVSLAIMAGVIATAAFGLVPIAISALVGALLLTLIGCIGADEVYERVDWTIIMLMAGLMPLGIAMNETGAAEFIISNTLGYFEQFGPHVMLAILYIMALILGEMMSNSAAAVLLTPLAMSTAKLLGADPTPFLIAVTFSASTSFITPIGYQTNTMVYAAGGYKFTDFVKVGVPLNLIFWILGVIFIPYFWPFYG